MYVLVCMPVVQSTDICPLLLHGMYAGTHVKEGRTRWCLVANVISEEIVL